MSDTVKMGIAKPAPRGTVWKRAALLAAALAVALLVAEGVARLAGAGRPVYAARRFGPAGGVPFTRLPEGLIVYQPGTTFWSVYDAGSERSRYIGKDGRVVYQINRNGMRGAAVPLEKKPNTFRVICLGDSITFGEGVHYPDTYPARLETLLGRAMPDRRVEVVNAGVQAYGTKEEGAFFLLKCLEFQPDVVTLGFFLNDVCDAAETIRQNEAMTTELPLTPFAQTSRLWELFERGQHARQMQADYFAMLRRGFASQRWDECQRVLAGLKKIGDEKRFRFVVVVFPVLWGLEKNYPLADLHAQVVQACSKTACPCIDLLETFQGRNSADLWVHPTDQHPNEEAHRLAAERIAKWIVD